MASGARPDPKPWTVNRVQTNGICWIQRKTERNQFGPSIHESETEEDARKWAEKNKTDDPADETKCYDIKE